MVPSKIEVSVKIEGAAKKAEEHWFSFYAVDETVFPKFITFTNNTDHQEQDEKYFKFRLLTHTIYFSSVSLGNVSYNIEFTIGQLSVILHNNTLNKFQAFKKIRNDALF